MYHPDITVSVPSQDPVDHALHGIAARFVAASTVMLQREKKNFLMIERSPQGLSLDMIGQRGERCGIMASPTGAHANILMVRRHGDKLIDALAKLWPSYAVPDSLGIITDGQAVYFSPDSPSLQDEEWFLRAARGDTRLCCLSGRPTALSRLLVPQRIAIIH